MIKPKHGKYQCVYCKEATIEGYFLPADTVYCYLCGMYMLMKDMVKIEKPKEVQVKPLNKVTGAFVSYDYSPNGIVSNLTVNGVPYTYRGKRI